MAYTDKDIKNLIKQVRSMNTPDYEGIFRKSAFIKVLKYIKGDPQKLNKMNLIRASTNIYSKKVTFSFLDEHEILIMPLEKMPLYINDDRLLCSLIAKWRLSVAR